MDWIAIAVAAFIALVVAMIVVWLSNNVDLFEDLIG